MSRHPPVYRLSLEAILPEKTVEDEIFTVTYKVTNMDTTVFPGGTILVLVALPSGVGLVQHSIQVHSLQPKGNPGQSMDKSYPDMRAISGLTVFFPPVDTFVANNGGTIELYLIDGRRLHASQLFAVTRARTHEEISQARSVNITAVSLIILILVQIADWFIRYYWRF